MLRTCRHTQAAVTLPERRFFCAFREMVYISLSQIRLFLMHSSSRRYQKAIQQLSAYASRSESSNKCWIIERYCEDKQYLVHDMAEKEKTWRSKQREGCDDHSLSTIAKNIQYKLDSKQRKNGARENIKEEIMTHGRRARSLLSHGSRESPGTPVWPRGTQRAERQLPPCPPRWTRLRSSLPAPPL